MTDGRAAPGPAPASVREWMVRFGGVDAEGNAGDLRTGGLRALSRALARPGRNREGAFALLAADGLLTAAVEEAARRPDPEGELEALVAAVGREGDEEPG